MQLIRLYSEIVRLYYLKNVLPGSLFIYAFDFNRQKILLNI